MKRVLAVAVVAVLAAATWTRADDGEKENRADRQKVAVFCTCGGCRDLAHTEDSRQCGYCDDGWTSSGIHSICSLCAHANDLCEHCGKPLQNTGPMSVHQGKISIVDKQPREDATYFVIEGESGGNQGVYVEKARPLGHAAKGRVLVRAMNEDGQGAAYIVRELLPLGPKADDKALVVETTEPVQWRAGGIAGEAVKPVDGKATLTIPAVAAGKIYVLCGKKILKTLRYEDGKWTEDAPKK